MMVIVPRIAAVSSLSTVPFVYGIEHADDLHAGLSLSSPDECIRNFTEHKVDIALVPASAVPSLADARIVTDYCVGASGESGAALLAGKVSAAEARRVILDPASPAASQLAVRLLQKRWKATPEYLLPGEDASLSDAAAGDLFLLTEDRAYEYGEQFPCVADLTAEWMRAERLPFVFWVWVVHEETPPEAADSLQAALTWGLEHTYEAILEHGYAEKSYAYEHLTQRIDYIYDHEKHKALQKFWNSGIKVSPRVNPG